jgi:uncharacterized Zn finger protein (UPF0148 family)
MSEDFDREAEKKRLREKLEDDQESRKATEHMSDLLLKGATMTNHHCDACGDPIFRYDGQEFCPTCGETVDDDGARGSEGGDETREDDPGETATAEVGVERATDADTKTADAGPSPTRYEESAEEGADEGRRSRRETAPSVGAAAGNLGEARASLVRTLSDLAARAESAEDVRRTRDCLAAAREAAEALAALDRVER